MINNIDINTIVVSNKLPFSKKDFKQFIGYKDAEKNRPFCIFRPKMSIHKRYFDKTRCLYFLIKNEKLLEKYNEIWEKVSNIIKKEFNTEPVHNKNYLKAGRKST